MTGPNTLDKDWKLLASATRRLGMDLRSIEINGDFLEHAIKDAVNLLSSSGEPTAADFSRGEIAKGTERPIARLWQEASTAMCIHSLDLKAILRDAIRSGNELAHAVAVANPRIVNRWELRLGVVGNPAFFRELKRLLRAVADGPVSKVNRYYSNFGSDQTPVWSASGGDQAASNLEHLRSVLGLNGSSFGSLRWNKDWLALMVLNTTFQDALFLEKELPNEPTNEIPRTITLQKKELRKILGEKTRDGKVILIPESTFRQLLKDPLRIPLIEQKTRTVTVPESWLKEKTRLLVAAESDS